eukprot:COSAG05_NODE_122_length_17611_cov_47.044655_15_plen_83_part_00
MGREGALPIWCCLLLCWMCACVSGDHGAMNSWDRTAYISDVKYGSPSYEAQMNQVNNNYVIANYGASQGFDTDGAPTFPNRH